MAPARRPDASAWRDAEVGDHDAARSRSMRTFSGLRSRCTTPAACAAASPGAQGQSEIATTRSSPSLQHLAARARVAERPRRRCSSIVRNFSPSCSPMSNMRATLRVGDAAREPDLLAKALVHRRVVRQVGAQELERDDLAELEVTHAVDAAHAADAEQAEDLVAARDDLGREARTVARPDAVRPAAVRQGLRVACLEPAHGGRMYHAQPRAAP
jgi:hypothetical protein